MKPLSQARKEESCRAVPLVRHQNLIRNKIGLAPLLELCHSTRALDQPPHAGQMARAGRSGEHRLHTEGLDSGNQSAGWSAFTAWGKAGSLNSIPYSARLRPFFLSRSTVRSAHLSKALLPPPKIQAFPVMQLSLAENLRRSSGSLGFVTSRKGCFRQLSVNTGRVTGD